MQHRVYIHTNRKQILGALVSKYTIERYSKNLDKFSVNILIAEENTDIQRILDKEICIEGRKTFYASNDLQSFTLARFLPPSLMNFNGRALVVDPDVFSTYSDVWDLLGSDMGGNAIMMKAHKPGQWATSVMLLENERLAHWRFAQLIDALLSQAIDYRDQMTLRNESAQIGQLSEVWNSYDKLDQSTKLLHNTMRITQPWKTGLAVDFRQKRLKPILGVIPREWLHVMAGRNPYRYRQHPDPKQISFFFGHLKSALLSNIIAQNVVQNEIDLRHIRPDAFNILEKTRAL